MNINTKIDWLWPYSRVIDPLFFTQNCIFLQACVAQVASCLIDICDNSFKIRTERKIKILTYKILQQSYNIKLNKYSIIKFLFSSISIVYRESQTGIVFHRNRAGHYQNICTLQEFGCGYRDSTMVMESNLRNDI